VSPLGHHIRKSELPEDSILAGIAKAEQIVIHT
jgi:hypothetical protein